MAEASAHRFGQIIGDALETALRVPLESAAKQHGLYLDGKGSRAVRQGQKKVGWSDTKGNRHDLDYVLEKGGTDQKIGTPKAFIEIAYRRYTKHSRNKAQEIQGAIVPLAEKYAHDHPFLGVVLAGEFTDGALTQLKSHKFSVLYIPFTSIVQAFKLEVNINTYYDEKSSDADVKKKVEACEKLTPADLARVGQKLLELHKTELDKFIKELETCLTRSIASIFVLPLNGQTKELSDFKAAISFIENYDEVNSGGPFVRYEVNIRYNNGDEIRANFKEKGEAIHFLNMLAVA